MIGVETHIESDSDALLSFETSLDGRKSPFGQVIMVNDDYTPMEYVVKVLMDVFKMSQRRAVDVMLKVHYEGEFICGEYPVDIAQTKAAKVKQIASKLSYPLLCRVDLKSR